MDEVFPCGISFFVINMLFNTDVLFAILANWAYRILHDAALPLVGLIVVFRVWFPIKSGGVAFGNLAIIKSNGFTLYLILFFCDI
jgi:hypothetical protein